jgi:NAD(P)H dehydrogenase (quinone)
MRFLSRLEPNYGSPLNNKRILVTGASGKTGKAVMAACLSRGYTVRALIHSPAQADSFESRIEVVVGDMSSNTDMLQAMDGITAVYHICPNMHPDEVDIGRRAIQAAKESGVRHFVYHSVLHPQIEEMPHHWKKMQVEGLLFKSGLNYTILQPAAYLQNLLQYKQAIVEQGIYAVPYNGETRIGMVDLRDVAEVAAGIITDSKYYGSIFELAMEEIYNQYQLIERFNQICNRKITFSEIPRSQWQLAMEKNGMPDYAITTLISMFEYYETYGFTGNGVVLKTLLGRSPNSLDEFAKEYFAY